MTYLKMNAAAMFIGFLLDLLIGDPEGWPHPVIWIGKYISLTEKRLRAKGGDLRKASMFLTGSTVVLTMLATAIILAIAALLGKAVLLIVMSVIAWTTLSCKCLYKEADGVKRALAVSVEAGRKRVARIVGRDTSELTREEIVKATVETVAENTTDGIITPMLCLLIGGPVLAMAFKAASTLDSMVGYLDEKYRDIGWSGARLDDVFNYIPARICGTLMCLVSAVCGLNAGNAFKMMKRDHANHLSPNCAWSESAAAGALGIQLGGTHSYFGKTIEKPTIGDALHPVTDEDIDRMGRLMVVTTSAFALILLLIAALI